MELFYTLVIFAVGMATLVFGARVLIRGASSLARLFGLSEWIIGILIVGIGTSIPEFAITLSSAFQGTAIGIGAIVGSNTFNALVVVGVLAMAGGVTLKKEWVERDIMLNLGVLIVAGVFVAFPIFGPSDFVGISRMEAFVLFVLFILWVVSLLKRKEVGGDEEEDTVVFGAFTSFLLVSAGIVGVFFGGDWVVDGGERLASIFSVSETLIGLTLVAVGSSLPELTVSLAALHSRKMSLAVGNIIGSNIFDFLGILGITGLIAPILIDGAFRFDVGVSFLALLLLYLFARFNGVYIITRNEGLVLVLAYVLYIIVAIFRG